MWFIYILQCSDTTFYTGITSNLERRIREHNKSKSVGAKYTRARRPAILVYKEECENRAQAGRREREIKRISRKEKEKLVLGASL